MERENFLNLADEKQREQELKWLYAYSGSNYKLILHGKSPDMRLLAGGIASAIEKSWGTRPEVNEIPENPDNGFFKTLVKLSYEDYGKKCLYIGTEKMLHGIEEIIGKDNFDYWNFSETPFCGSIIDCLNLHKQELTKTHDACKKIGVVSYLNLFVDAADLTTLLHAAYWYKILSREMSIFPELYCRTSENKKIVEKFLKKLGIRYCYFKYPQTNICKQDILYIRPSYLNADTEAVGYDEYVVPGHVTDSSLFRKIFHSFFLKKDMKKILSEHQDVLV